MTLKTSSVGSYPPLYDPNQSIHHKPKQEQDEIVRQSIERAIHDQKELDIDVLVDGQARDDVISLICPYLLGFSGNTLPYRVIARIQPSKEPITVADYLLAKKLAGGKPLKAHLTGPMTIIRSAFVDPNSGYASKTDPTLIKDIAFALGQEAKFLVGEGAEIVQIDEPVLADGVDLDLAFEAIRQIIEIGEIPFPALHVCGNVSRILPDILTRSPVKMVSLEGSWLKREELAYIDRNYMTQCGKQFGLGCISVVDYNVERPRTVQNFLDQMVTRLGAENIWAVMPNCGLRPVPYEIAKAKLKVIVDAAKSLAI
ncbi:MAG: hypothetical protein KJ077_38000 [Anaerolineae bacterium]|nr:hypothetical protein [Anaerolineae bacterium]